MVPRREPFGEWAPGEFEASRNRPLCLYFHIPFCRQRCSFCPFFRNQFKKGISAEYSRLLIADLLLNAKGIGHGLKRRKVDAVYFGGGTPSDLAAEDLAGILRAVRETFWLDPDTEVTVEGRIRDFTMEKADAWVSAGANRFSLGLQTTDIPLRRRLGRFADRGEIVSVLNGLGETGALVIVDLIYGLPGQTENAVTEDIRFVAEETGIDGLDCYALKQFPGSPLAEMIRSGRMDRPPGAERLGALFRAAHESLEEQGFEHFTLQHWRRNPEERSLYNRLAKKDSDILPIGAGAGGRLGSTQIMRENSFSDYRRGIETGNCPGRFFKAECLSETNHGFKTLLSECVEERKLPAPRSWPAETESWRSEVLLNWRSAGLLAETGSEDTDIPLSPAGCYWAPHMTNLLNKALSDFGDS